MTVDALGQSFLVKMPAILSNRRMAAETIVKLEQGLTVRFMACAAFILHRSLFWKGFPFQRNSGMATGASFLLGFQSVAVVFGGKLVASRAMECLHAANIRARSGVASSAFLGGWFDRVKRRQMA